MRVQDAVRSIAKKVRNQIWLVQRVLTADARLLDLEDTVGALDSIADDLVDIAFEIPREIEFTPPADSCLDQQRAADQEDDPREPRLPGI